MLLLFDGGDGVNLEEDDAATLALEVAGTDATQKEDESGREISTTGLCMVEEEDDNK